ncbi:MAG: hypothetical protein ACK41C_17070 [Phenylobacterium sp.]|uniref:hypothetical protein n=1 Tax=Phenylobacterium sp. TaxID=1871053 RepID=UPI00391D0912
MNWKIGLAAVSAALISSAALAAVTFDPATGTGFVGKGDVQLVYGWNNKALQDNAGSVQFRANATTVTEVSWICTNSNNEQTQERARTTTTEVQGVVTSVARERNQITGFNLNGYSGTPTQSSETEGPPLNSCPSGPWTLTTPAGAPEVVGGGADGLEVSTDGTTWYPVG